MLQIFLSIPTSLRLGIVAGRTAVFFVILILAGGSAVLWGTTQTVVYNGGNIPTTYWVNPSTTKRAEVPGLLLFV